MQASNSWKIWYLCTVPRYTAYILVYRNIGRNSCENVQCGKHGTHSSSAIQGNSFSSGTHTPLISVHSCPTLSSLFLLGTYTLSCQLCLWRPLCLFLLKLPTFYYTWQSFMCHRSIARVRSSISIYFMWQI